MTETVKSDTPEKNPSENFILLVNGCAATHQNRLCVFPFFFLFIRITVNLKNNVTSICVTFALRFTIDILKSQYFAEEYFFAENKRESGKNTSRTEGNENGKGETKMISGCVFFRPLFHRFRGICQS